MTEENKPETLDKKVVRMFLAGELRNVSCLTDDLDNASCPIEIDNPASRRLVTLAADCEFVPIRRIGDLICDALTAQEAFNFGFRHDNQRIVEAVLDARAQGKLRVFEAGGVGVIRDGDVLRGAIKREDFGRLLWDEWNLTVSGAPKPSEFTPATSTSASPDAPETPPAPASEPAAPDYSMLATRDKLIAAFGAFTGMDASWFGNLTDKPALLAARKVRGQGGRGHIAEPWFCPLEVMQWLVSPKRKKGRKLNEGKAWELLEKNFPQLYAAKSVGDPREV